MSAGLPILADLKRSVEDTTTFHFNPGLFENDPPEFEDMDDVFATLQHRSEKATALIEELYEAAEEARNQLEILGDDNMSPELADTLDGLDIALAKARGEQS